MFLIKFNEKYEVCCHGNICASTLPISCKARYVSLKAYKKMIELPSQMIKLTQSVSSKFTDYLLFTVDCHQQIYRIFAIYSRLSPANSPNICYWQSTVTSHPEKILVSYFSMRNPYMKLQNPSMPGFWRTDGLMHAWMDNPKPICPVNFFEVGGITSIYLWHSYWFLLRGAVVQWLERSTAVRKVADSSLAHINNWNVHTFDTVVNGTGTWLTSEKVKRSQSSGQGPAFQTCTQDTMGL